MIPLLFALMLPDIDGIARRFFEPGSPTAIFFISNDCPVANHYAPEIHRICDEYKDTGLRCALVYVDPALTVTTVKNHAAEFQHGEYPKLIDRKHTLVKAAGATTTPEVALVGEDGKLAYRGRIDDFYVTSGKPRRAVREATLRNALDAYFAGRPIQAPTTKAIGCYIADLAAAPK